MCQRNLSRCSLTRQCKNSRSRGLPFRFEIAAKWIKRGVDSPGMSQQDADITAAFGDLLRLHLEDCRPFSRTVAITHQNLSCVSGGLPGHAATCGGGTKPSSASVAPCRNTTRQKEAAQICPPAARGPPSASRWTLARAKILRSDARGFPFRAGPAAVKRNRRPI